MDNWSLLATCELCGCLVHASTLRALDYLGVCPANASRQLPLVMSGKGGGAAGVVTRPARPGCAFR
jgi:hypothetical protein